MNHANADGEDVHGYRVGLNRDSRCEEFNVYNSVIEENIWVLDCQMGHFYDIQATPLDK